MVCNTNQILITFATINYMYKNLITFINFQMNFDNFKLKPSPNCSFMIMMRLGNKMCDKIK